MKVLICNTLKSQGGAAKASQRICDCLSKSNIDCKYHYLFENGMSSKSMIPKIDAIPKLLCSKDRKIPFSSSIVSFGTSNKIIKKYKPDILHLNYTNMGLFSINEIGDSKIPIVWTLHDSWAFTGGCHLPLDCTKFKNYCSNCPALQSKKNYDLSSFIFSKKLKHWKSTNITAVCPSKWMFENAKNSKIFEEKKIVIIPNPINTNIFKPKNKNEARKLLNLDKNKKYILFGSMNPLTDKNKGFEYLKDALNLIPQKNTELLIFGTNEKITNFPIPIRSLGYIEDETTLANVYSSADTTVVPSISENLPYVMIESLACGTPVIGFKVGGIPEIISKNIFGKLVGEFDIKNLGESINETLSTNLGEQVRDEIHKEIEIIYGYKAVSKQYIDLYHSLSLQV
jgi:glycosyltransferase involved in cell wall biosynthesis